MATLGQRTHTLGNVTRYILDYDAWLEEDASLSDADITCASPDVTISSIKANPDRTVTFLLAGGVLNEIFTLAVQVTDSRTEVKNDTIDFRVISP